MGISKLIKWVFLVVTIGLFWQEAGWAQTTGQIRGVVHDDATGDPLPGVNVLVLRTEMGAATDEQGRYIINNVPVGTYDVQARMIGYAQLTKTGVLVTIDQISTVDFDLVTQAIAGESVTVMASPDIMHFETSNTQQVASSSQITAAPAMRSLADFLEKQPSFTSRGEMEIRGGSADQIGTMINGVTLTDQRFDNPETAIPLSAINQAAIISGGFNAEYGNFRSGLINIATKTGDRDRYSGSLDLSGNVPHMKHAGESIFSPFNYFLRPELDPSVAFTGTEAAWANDDYLRQQYARFAGWNNLVENYNGGKPEDQHATALDLYLWDAWIRMAELPVKELEAQGYSIDPNLVQLFKDHAREQEGGRSDWNLDFGLGGPIPLVSQALGNATFYISHNSNRYHYAIPIRRNGQDVNTSMLSLQSSITPSLKLQIQGYYNSTYGVMQGQSAYSYPNESLHPINNLGTAEVGTYSWYPERYVKADRYVSMIGVKLDNVVSVKANWTLNLSRSYFVDNAGEPRVPRDPTILARFGPIPVNKQPYGWSPGNQVLDGFQYGEYEQPYGARTAYYSNIGHAWFDSTKTENYQLRFDLTSQVNPHNQFKSGVDFSYVNLDHNMYSRRPGHPENNYDYFWERYPIQGGAYLQDRITYQGIVANLGVRVDYYDPQGNWPTGEKFTYKVYGGAIDNLWEHWSELDQQGQYQILEPVKSYWAVSPRLGLAFPVSANSKFFFNYGHFRSRTPSRRNYMIRQSRQNGVYELGNPNMAPPRTIAYETGVEYNLLNQFLIRISGYYKDVTGEYGDVRYISEDGRLGYNSYDNNRYRDIQGVELSVTKSVGEWLTGWINYNYMLQKTGLIGIDNYYENPSQRQLFGLYQGQETRPLPRPRFSANVTLSTPINFGPEVAGHQILGGWQLSLLPSWTAGDYFTWNPLGKLHVQDNLQWPAYYVWDIRVLKRFTTRGVQMEGYMDIQNLFNNPIRNMASGLPFSSGGDEQRYLASLHLPMYDSEEYDNLRERNPGQYEGGNDKPGMLRSSDKSYINDPDIYMLMNSEPRDIWFGIRILF